MYASNNPRWLIQGASIKGMMKGGISFLKHVSKHFNLKIFPLVQLG